MSKTFAPFCLQPRRARTGRRVASAGAGSTLRCTQASQHPSQARRDTSAESSFLTYGLALHLRLLSTPPFGDAVTFGYRVGLRLPWKRLAPFWSLTHPERTRDAVPGVRHRPVTRPGIRHDASVPVLRPRRTAWTPSLRDDPQRRHPVARPPVDRGRGDRLPGPPPSEPCRRISRTRLSGQWFALRRADCTATWADSKE